MTLFLGLWASCRRKIWCPIVFGIAALLIAPPAFSQIVGGVAVTGGGSQVNQSIPHRSASITTAAVSLIPTGPTSVGNCIPFGDNAEYGFTGFIYRNVPPFAIAPGSQISFDLGALNDQPIRRNIFLAVANINPAPAVVSGGNVVSQGVFPLGWTQVVSTAQVPTNPFGNAVSGDYELGYTVEAPFAFPGGGLIIGFQGSPPAAFPDGTCDGTLVATDPSDPSGYFYARFFYKPDLSLGVLDIVTAGSGSAVALGGVVISGLVEPCVGNNPPAFTPPTPSCGSTIQSQAGSNVSFTVTAADPDSIDAVALTATGLPVGSSMVPVLPISGNPVSSAFSWVPGVSDSGNHLITFTATDRCGARTDCSITVNVVTNRAPDCSGAYACDAVLWPPNHGYHAVSICGVTDPDGNPVAITVTGVTQDEPVNGRGDGNTCPDAQIANGQASVRAERAGTPGVPGNGRVYTVSFAADDGKGGRCIGFVNVCVPHDQADPTCIDDGQRYNSAGACAAGDALAAESVADFSLSVVRVNGSEANVEFALPVDTHVSVAVYDVAGRKLAGLEDGLLSTGVYERNWNMVGVPKGIYFVSLRAGAAVLTKTVIKTR